MVDFLAVGTHPDDVEIGVGGTLATLIGQGRSCVVLDMTNGEPTPHGTPQTRAAETEKASAIIGLKHRVLLDLPNRWLMDTTEARVKVAEAFRTLKPKVLLLPHWEDAHPDHIQSSQIAQAARFISKYTKTDMAGDPYYPPRVFYYFCSHLKKAPAPTFVFDVTEGFGRKIQAIRAYHSQFFAGGADKGEEFIRRLEAQAAYFGGLVGAKYGEPLLSHEMLGVRSFDSFLA